MDVRKLFNMTMQRGFSGDQASYDDKELWTDFKRVWNQLSFGLLHHKKSKLEAREEYYQVLYESCYMVWLESALADNTCHRLEYTCLLIFTWYCLVETYRLSGLPEVCP